MYRYALALLAVAGCSHPGRSPHGGGNGSGSGNGPDAAATQPAPADAAPAAAPVTEMECDDLIDHILAIITVKARDDLSPDDRIAAEAQAHASLRAEFLDTCLALD